MLSGSCGTNCSMSTWKNVKVRLDTWDRVAVMAASQSRSVSAMADVLLRGALESVPGDSPQVQGSSRAGTPAPSRAPGRGEPEGPANARTESHRSPVPARPIPGQMTVEEMLAGCPQCSETLVPAEQDSSVLVCPDCGYVREPS